MPANLNHRPPGASSALLSAEDEALSQPATLGDLAELRAYLEGTPEQSPCWCPDAPGRHLRNCHIEVIDKLARQWTCTGSAGVPGTYMADCDCPQCRFEWTMGKYTDAINNLAAEIRDVGFGMDMNITDGKREEPDSEDAVADGLDLKERYARVIKAAEHLGLEQEENENGEGRWNCAHPEHADEHPSMSILKDNKTGKISLYCHTEAIGKGDPRRNEWVSACLKELGLPWSVLHPRSRVGPDHEAPF